MLSAQRIIIAPEWREALRNAGLDTVKGVYEARGEAVTRSGSTQVVRLLLDPILPAAKQPQAAARTLFIKKYWVRGFGDLRRTFLRGAFFGRSKVKREFQNIAFLRAAGLDAPAPVAYGEQRNARALIRSFLITEGVAQPMTLTEFIRDHLPSLAPDEQRAVRRTLIEKLASHTRQMHGRHFVHHDYFWRNILLNGTSLSRFWLIDMPKGRRWRSGGESHRAKDLATLDAPAPLFFRRTERLRFLLHYLEAERLAPAQTKLIGRILRIAEPLRDEQRRRVGISRRELHGTAAH